MLFHHSIFASCWIMAWRYFDEFISLSFILLLYVPLKSWKLENNTYKTLLVKSVPGVLLGKMNINCHLLKIIIYLLHEILRSFLIYITYTCYSLLHILIFIYILLYLQLTAVFRNARYVSHKNNVLKSPKNVMTLHLAIIF